MKMWDSKVTLSGVGDVDPSVGQQNGIRFLQIVRDVLDGAHDGQLKRAEYHAILVAGREFRDTEMSLHGRKFWPQPNRATHEIRK